VLHVEVCHPVRRDLNIETGIQGHAERILHVDVGHRRTAAAALGIEDRVIHAHPDIRAEALPGQWVILQRQCRRQGPDAAQVDVAERGILHVELMSRRGGDQVERQGVHEEVGEVDLSGPGIGRVGLAADRFDMATGMRQHADHAGADQKIARMLAADSLLGVRGNGGGSDHGGTGHKAEKAVHCLGSSLQGRWPHARRTADAPA